MIRIIALIGVGIETDRKAKLGSAEKATGDD
jgi:hypothetical protein